MNIFLTIVLLLLSMPIGGGIVAWTVGAKGEGLVVPVVVALWALSIYFVWFS
jgi:hypothetical protein